MNVKCVKYVEIRIEACGKALGDLEAHAGAARAKKRKEALRSTKKLQKSPKSLSKSLRVARDRVLEKFECGIMLLMDRMRTYNLPISGKFSC